MFIICCKAYDLEPYTDAAAYSEALALCEMLAYQTGWMFYVAGDDPFIDSVYDRMWDNQKLWEVQHPEEHLKRKQEMQMIRLYGRY